MKRDRPRRILRALAAAQDGMLLTTEIVEVCGEVSEQRALSWYGAILRRYEQDGLAERAEWVKLGWGKGRVCRWRITPAGRDLVRYWGEEPIRQARAAAAEEALAALAAKRKAALALARGAYSRATPRDMRVPVAQGLRDLGCHLEEIGEVFGVSREMIRQDLLLPPDWHPAPPGPWPKKLRAPKRFDGRRLRSVSRLDSGMLAGLTDVTLAEW